MQMWNAENLSLTEMREFLQASQQIEFNGQGRQQIYAWVQQTLVEQEYFRQRKKHRGVITGTGFNGLISRCAQFGITTRAPRH